MEVSEEEALHVALSPDEKTRKVLAGLKTPLLALLHQLEEYAPRVAATKDAAARLTLEAQHNTARHCAWLLSVSMHLPVAVTGNSTALSTAAFSAYLLASVSTVARLALASQGVSRTETTNLIDAWAQAATVLLPSVEAAAAQSPSELLTTAAHIVPFANVLASSADTGCALLVRLIQATVPLDQGALGQQFFQSIVAGPVANSADGSKGLWATKYLQFVASLHTQPAESTEAVRKAFQWVLSTVHSKPQLFVGVDWEGLYSFALNWELRAAGERIGAFGRPDLEEEEEEDASAVQVLDKEQLRAVLEATRAVAEKAVVACPTKGQFWALLEEVERRLGNNQAANHVSWRKTRAGI